MKSILMYILGRMSDSELVTKAINTSGESFSVLCGFRTASKKEILKSYRKLAVKWHPDQYKGDDKKKAEKMFIDIAAAKEVLTDPGKQNSLVCISVLPFVRSNGSSIIHSVGSVVCMVGRSVGPSFVRTVGPFLRFYGRSVVCLFGRLIVIFGLVSRLVVIWFVRFHSKKSYDYIRLFVHLVQCSLFRFFVQSSIRLCSFLIVRVLVLPVVSSSVLFFLLVCLLFSCLIVPTSNVAV